MRLLQGNCRHAKRLDAFPRVCAFNRSTLSRERRSVASSSAAALPGRRWLRDHCAPALCVREPGISELIQFPPPPIAFDPESVKSLSLAFDNAWEKIWQVGQRVRPAGLRQRDARGSRQTPDRHGRRRRNGPDQTHRRCNLISGRELKILTLMTANVGTPDQECSWRKLKND